MIKSFLDVRVPYIYKNRQVLLPWVEDWSDPQDHIRKEWDVGKLKWIDWFWCHPTAYVLFYYSLYISGFFTTSLMATISLIFWSTSLAVVFYIFSILFAVVGLYKKKDYKFIKDKTMYDAQMRDDSYIDLSIKE